MRVEHGGMKQPELVIQGIQVVPEHVSRHVHLLAHVLRDQDWFEIRLMPGASFQDYMLLIVGIALAPVNVEMIYLSVFQECIIYTMNIT
jgi:hypothetical protein